MAQSSVEARRRAQAAMAAEKPKGKSKPKWRMFNLQGMDIPMLTIIIILLMFGLVMLYSASYAYAYLYYRDSFLYIRSQLQYAVLGIVAMLVASFIDYHVWKKFAWALMLVTVVLLVVVLFMEPGQMDANRWIWLNGAKTRSFQPSEIAKFAVILLFASLISVHEKRMHTFTYGFLPYFILLATVCGLLLLEPHMSGFILIMGIGMCMMFMGGTRLRWFFFLAVAGTVLIAIIMLFPDLMSHVYYRITSWAGADEEGGELIYQTYQSLVAVGSGGVTGRGIGNSRQKFLFLPEMYNDYIFAVLCEELGLIGALVLIALFLLFLFRGLYIAFRAKDTFGRMLALGITIQVALQALLHMGVNIDLFPSTGIALPFFSSGGTALCMILGQMGILLSVSRQANLAGRAKKDDEEAAKEAPAARRAAPVGAEDMR